MRKKRQEGYSAVLIIHTKISQVTSHKSCDIYTSSVISRLEKKTPNKRYGKTKDQVCLRFCLSNNK